jgi:succinate dehydrogenase / fumarate reductase flavoprotein subunit
VFGKRAGEKTGCLCGDRSLPKLDARHYQAEAEAELKQVLNQSGEYSSYDLRTRLQDTMTEHCGIYRDGDRLAAGLEQLQRIKHDYENKLKISDRSMVFNMELTAAWNYAA